MLDHPEFELIILLSNLSSHNSFDMKCQLKCASCLEGDVPKSQMQDVHSQWIHFRSIDVRIEIVYAHVHRQMDNQSTAFDSRKRQRNSARIPVTRQRRRTRGLQGSLSTFWYCDASVLSPKNSRIKQKFLYDIISTEEELRKNESIYALYLLNYYSRSLSLKSVTIHLPQCAQSIWHPDHVSVV